MISPSFRDMEILSAYLDGQLSPAKKARLEKRLQMEAGLAAAFGELRQTRAILQRMPKRRAPRNFMLTPRMAGIRPPVPRLVPAFGWASAVAMLLFVFTLGTGLLGQLSARTAAPMLAAAPGGYGGGPPASAPLATANPAPATNAPATNAPAIAAPVTSMSANPEAATETPTSQLTQDQTGQVTPTGGMVVMAAPEATQVPTGELQPSPAAKRMQKSLNPWLLIWPSLGILLAILALVVWWLNRRAFQRKNSKG